MNKITAIILAKNEEAMIQGCIKSVSFCDEIVVIDNQSSDNTSQLAKEMGAKVIKYEGKDFSEMRNKGLQNSTSDWILYIDADERATPELQDEIRKIVQKEGFSAYRITRNNYYLGTFEWPKKEKLERFFKKKSLKRWFGVLHESPEVEGTIGDLESNLIHYTHRNLSMMLKKTIEWSDIEAKLRIQHNHPRMTWWRFPRVMATAFTNSYIHDGGWKVGTAGLIESVYQAFSMFITYAKLWELQNDKNIH